MYQIIPIEKNSENKNGYIKKLEVVFDFSTLPSKNQTEINFRMNPIYNNKLKNYLKVQEKLDCPNKYVKHSKIWTRIANNKGFFYSDSHRDIYLSKDILHPTLRLKIYSVPEAKTDNLFNIEKFEYFLKTGEIISNDIGEKPEKDYITN